MTNGSCCLGVLRRSPTGWFLRLQCLLYLLPQTPLSHVRSVDRPSPCDPFCSTSARGFDSHGSLPVAILCECDFGVSRVEGTSRCAAGCLGACSLGSVADLRSDVWHVQPGPCFGLLALLAYPGVRSSAQRHYRDYFVLDCVAIGANVVSLFVVHPASKGFCAGTEGSPSRVRQ